MTTLHSVTAISWLPQKENAIAPVTNGGASDIGLNLSSRLTSTASSSSCKAPSHRQLEMHTVGRAQARGCAALSRALFASLLSGSDTGSGWYTTHTSRAIRFHVPSQEGLDRCIRGSKMLINAVGSLVLFQVAKSDEPIGFPTLGLKVNSHCS